MEHKGNFSDSFEKYGLSKLKVNVPHIKFKQKEFNNKKTKENIKRKTKSSFKDTYELKILPQKIEQMEKKLKELEILLTKENLYNDDKKTFDDTINQIGAIKTKLSIAEERWLQIEILNDEINNH